MDPTWDMDVPVNEQIVLPRAGLLATPAIGNF
jgi:hypothetical protein